MKDQTRRRIDAGFSKWAFLAGGLLPLLAGIGSLDAQAPKSNLAALPAGNGREDLGRACSMCHQLSIVTSRRDTRAGWQATVNTMVARGAPLTAAQAGNVVAYLAEHFAATGDAAAPKAAAASPFAVNLPKGRNPLDTARPVTGEMLAQPPADNWITWRGGSEALGYSPLAQINTGNVDRLKVAWTWSLPPGPNESTPIVHDGVLLTQSYGDFVQAFDATNGDLLWQYNPKLVGPPNYKKNIAVYHDKVLLGTSDAHMVALSIRTGEVVWDTPIGDKGMSISGGPVVAHGKVIQGTMGYGPGGDVIVALDVETGKEAWRFHTIAQPGDPADSTWNGIPVEQRSGGSVWTAGSYDPDLNLVYFGVAPTYNTGPLRKVESRKVTNDALYTDATIALNPDTGKLVWHYQHMKNDQWDMDWAFERMILRLPVDGKERKLVVTAGKPGVYDALDAATGKYVFSKDMGLQNLIVKIDPKTGEKTTNPALDPTRAPFEMCPYFNSGKEWLPASYNPASKRLLVPMNEACMDILPLPPGEPGLLTGLTYKAKPKPGGDGLYSHVAALNLQTRSIEWVFRQRAPVTTGTLSTAGGLVFAGFVDRRFKALDEATGRELWSIRLNDVPSSAPITYQVNGKQYVAMVVGCCGVQARDVLAFVPEVKNPPDRGAALWVFELGADKAGS